MDSATYSALVAENVENALEAAGRSVLSIAESTGIPRSTLDRRLKSHGGSPFSVREVKAIAIVLGITAAELLVVEDAVEGRAA